MSCNHNIADGGCCPICAKVEHPNLGYQHPKSIAEFEKIYRAEYEQQLIYIDKWIDWCKSKNDHYGVNFHQGMRSSLIFNDIKMWQLIRILKREHPNA